MNLGITIGTWTVGTGTCIGTTRQTGTACTSSCRYYTSTAVGICRIVLGTSIGTRTSGTGSVVVPHTTTGTTRSCWYYRYLF
jgi:hypothetical protein